MNTIATRINALLEKKNGGNQSDLARFCGVSPQAVQKWIAGASSPKGKNLESVAAFFNVTPAYIQFGESATQRQIGDYTLVSADDTDAEKGSIDYWNVKGSCGGGFLNFDPIPKGQLIREASFFRKYDTKPEHAFAIYADGDSMADRIGDGDLCIFNSIKTTPVSGEIYLIDHPDGLRIKKLRRLIDGTWILESNNPDKRRFPDEVIPAGYGELLKIRGLFLYRQG